MSQRSIILFCYSTVKKSINIKYEYAVFGNSSLHKCYLYRLRKNTIYDRINQHQRRFFSRWLRFLSFFLPNYMKLIGVFYNKNKRKQAKKLFKYYGNGNNFVNLSCKIDKPLLYSNPGPVGSWTETDTNFW